MRRLLFFVLACLVATPAFAVPHALRGSAAKMAAKRALVKSERLSYFSHAEFMRIIRSAKRMRSGLSVLVRIEETPYLHVVKKDDHPEHAEERFWIRPETAEFLKRIARSHYFEFNTPLVLNSGFRCLAHQALEAGNNPNAAKKDPPHTTGATVDIAYKDMSFDEILWMEKYLIREQQQGAIIATEEASKRKTFDVMVARPSAKPARHRT